MHRFAIAMQGHYWMPKQDCNRNTYFELPVINSLLQLQYLQCAYLNTVNLLAWHLLDYIVHTEISISINTYPQQIINFNTH